MTLDFLNTYINAHHIYLPSQVSGALLTLATIDMAIRTISTVGKEIIGSTDPKSEAKNQRNFSLNFCSVLTWGILASNYVPFFAVVGLTAFAGWSILVDQKGRDSYLSMRICKQIFVTISPIINTINKIACSMLKVFFRAFNHQIGYALVAVLTVVALYHSPVLLKIPGAISWIGH